jgi:pimeloyl-ACP methyl ester carboxylesterase
VKRSIGSGVAQVVVATAALTVGGVTVGELRSDEAGDSVDGGFDVEEVERATCPDSRFECVTITVPRDHFASPGDGDTWEVTYAIQPAAVERRGTFVTITGGPGSGGIFSADGYTDAMSPLITDHYDIVFLNQRGSGPFQPVRCDAAAAAFSLAPLDVDAAGAADAIAGTVRGFVDDCIAEGDIDVADLPFYATRQAVEDLELVRQHLGVEQLSLYGESYGTQFVQTYAAAHPDHVAVLIVDGVVDLTVESDQWYDEAARAYDDALMRTFQACAADEACVDDAGTDDLATAYDELSERLADAPVAYELPMPDGTTERRRLTPTDLSVAAGGNVGSFSGRMQLLRVLNAALNENYVPLARMALQYVYLDPETLEVVPDPSWSDALFYAVECQDYSFYVDAGSPRERLDAWLSDFVAGPNDELRLGDVALGDLPCLFWPAQPGDVDRPDPIVDPPYPTFVLTADADPATPMVNALRVFERLEDAYLVILQDGPHVIFDWGYTCVDDLIAGYLGEGTPPPTRITICDGDIIDPYAPLPADSPDEIAALDRDPLGAMSSVETELFNNVEYALWPGDEPLEFGCDFGGAVRYELTDAGTDIALDACELSAGYPVSGTVTTDDEAGTLLMTAATPSGDVEYSNDGTTVAVVGTWDGEPVDESFDLTDA